MLENVIFTAIGAALGWVTSHLYAKSSDKQFKSAFAALEARMGNQELLLRRVADDVRPKQPEIAKAIEDALGVKGVEPAVLSTKDACPRCGESSLRFARWGVGPLGVSNALYQCGKCKYSFQTAESSSDA